MKSIILVLTAIVVNLTALAQGVAINASGNGPKAHSILDIDSDDKGVFFPRLTTGARTTLGTSLINTDNGMFVYDKDLLVFFYWDGTQWVQVGAGTGSDNQNLTGATLTGTSLQIDIEDGNSTTVDLSALQDDADNDPNNEIELPAGGANGQILSTDGFGNYTWISDDIGADDQNISGSELSGNILTIGIEGGTSETIDLSSIKDHDWHEVGGTTQPNNINDNIYTQGNVGIGVVNPQEKLQVDGGFTMNTDSDFERRYGVWSTLEIAGSNGNPWTPGYLHLKTTIDPSLAISHHMFVLHFTGFDYGNGSDIIDSYFSGYSWQGLPTSLHSNKINNVLGTANRVHIDRYYISTDNKVCVVLYSPSWYYTTIQLDVSTVAVYANIHQINITNKSMRLDNTDFY